MADQFTEFKKCITWRKNEVNATWTGAFNVDKTEGCPGISYSVDSMPNQNMRSAKTEITERLYMGVTNYCNRYKLDMTMLIKAYLKAKTNEKDKAKEKKHLAKAGNK